MVEEAELAEGDVEEGAPGGVVGRVEIKNHRDVALDVDELSGGGRNRLRLGITERIGGARGSW
uniref:Uncharacterized protein n=1 Tax=Arundo donax TaxID=35708 RepID=A0A0A9HTJ0_ARUDO